MSFQWIFNNAETISIESKQVIASTQTRDGTLRSVSRGGQVWRFEVKFPDGWRWTDLRAYITQAEALDRNTAASVQITNLSWLNGYLGNYVSPNTCYVNATQGSKTLSIQNSPQLIPSTGYKFKTGDYIQLGTSGKVYRVTADVPYNSATVYVHRPVLETTGQYTLKTGTSVNWNVICKDYPSWTIFGRDQVSWNGPFVFYEVI